MGSGSDLDRRSVGDEAVQPVDLFSRPGLFERWITEPQRAVEVAVRLVVFIETLLRQTSAV